MKIETCRFNEMMNTCMNYIILLTGINLILLVQGFYGNTHFQIFLENVRGNPLIVFKVCFVLLILVALFLIKLIFRKNPFFRRRFIRLRISSFIFILVFFLLVETIFLIYLVYLGDPLVIQNRDFLTIIQRAMPNLFIIVQVNLIIFPILGATCRRRYFM